jgi:hypothetical protein
LTVEDPQPSPAARAPLVAWAMLKGCTAGSPKGTEVAAHGHIRAPGLLQPISALNRPPRGCRKRPIRKINQSGDRSAVAGMRAYQLPSSRRCAGAAHLQLGICTRRVNDNLTNLAQCEPTRQPDGYARRVRKVGLQSTKATTESALLCRATKIQSSY